MEYDKEKLKLRIIQALLILAWAYICVFYILKKAGVINTPFWLEISPQIVGLISGAAILFGLIEFFIRLRNLPDNHEKLTNRVDRIGIGLTKFEKDVDFLKSDVGAIKTDVKQLMKCKNYKPAY